MFLRSPITMIKGRPPRILLYARYSTEEQDASSIPDQFAFSRKFLESQDVKEFEASELHDAELSGELVERPGINAVAAGVRDGRWDVIVVEDSSRLYRAVAPALGLVGRAVDKGIRVLCINDDVDTTDDYWSDRLTEALSHHARSNRFTAQRIKRRHDALWEMGAALGPTKVGYKRRATTPASMGEPARGPFFDEIDPEQQPIIVEVFERISNGEPPWAVATWLNTTDLPKSGNAKEARWTVKRVTDLIKRPDYRGEQFYRNTVVKKQFETGKHKLVRNEAGPLRRAMPHLQMVSDWLWHSANDAITGRRPVAFVAKRGREHRLAGIPRDSRGPLSENFFCGICQAKMYQDGRGTGGYRCSGVRSVENQCWNKASTYRELTHRVIGEAIAKQLTGAAEQMAMLMEDTARRVASPDSFHQMLTARKSEETRIERSMENLAKMVDRLGDGPGDALDKIADKLREREKDLHRCRLEIERLQQLIDQEQSANVSSETIRAAIDDAARRLLDLDAEAGVLVRQLAPQILAMPYQQFGTNKVVLRAKFDLKLASFLPEQMRALLNSDTPMLDGIPITTVPMCVDLFEMSNSPKFGLQALELQRGGLTLDQIGEALGISKRSAHLAVHYGAAMQEAGVTDPFFEIHDPPANASRWRPRGHRRQAG